MNERSSPEIADLRRDIIELRDWKAAILDKCKASDGFDQLKWGGDKEGWGFIHYFIGHLETRALHAETVLAEQDTARSSAGIARPLPPYPLCRGNNISEGVFYAEGSSAKEAAVRCATCGCRAPMAAWVRNPAQPAPDPYRETVRKIAAVREKRLAELRDCLQSIADMPTEEPREPDDADWRFRCLSAVEAAKNTLAHPSTEGK